jgi:hypothetical protein
MLDALAVRLRLACERGLVLRHYRGGAVVIAVVGHRYFGVLDDEGGVSGGVGKLEVLRWGVVTRLPAAFIEVVVEGEDVSVDEGVIELPDGVLVVLDDMSVEAVVVGAVVVVVVVEPGVALAPLLL